MNRTRSEAREAGSIADGAQRGNTGQRIHCKGGEQTEIRLQVLYCRRGDCRRASAVRAYKVGARRPLARAAHSKRCTTINNYYQLTRSAKNDKHEQQHRRRHREHRRHR